MLRSASLGVTVALLAACGERSTAPESTTAEFFADLASAQGLVTNHSIPFSVVDWIPCANGGAGENVSLVGMLHETFHVTQTSSGKSHVRYQVQPQGVVGTGMLTGTKFVATGVTQESFGAQAGSPHTFINIIRMIGQGSAVNFQVHETLHVTVNANGEVTSEVDNVKTTCE